MGSKEHPRSPWGFLRFCREGNLYKTKTFVKPGFHEPAHTFDEMSQHLADRGHNVYTLEEPEPLSRDELTRELNDAIAFARRYYHVHHPDIDEETLNHLFLSIPPTIFEGALQLIRTLEQETVVGEPVKVVAHSRGAMESAVAAFLRPDLFPNNEKGDSYLVLLNPAGMTGREHIKQSAPAASKKIRDGKVAEAQKALGITLGDIGRVGSIMTKCIVSTFFAYKDTPKDSAAKEKMKVAWDEGMGALKNPSRAIREAHAMANTDIFLFLQFNHTVNGLNIIAVRDKNDALFSDPIIERRLAEHSYIQSFVTEGGTHFAPITIPETVAEIVDTATKQKETTAL